MLQILRPIIVPARIFLLLSCAACLVSCRSDETRLRSDGTAASEVNRITGELQRKQKLSQRDIDSIREISEKYPGSESARQALRSALISREDWESLEQSLEQVPQGELKESEKIMLGNVYLKRGRYGDAVRLLQPLGDEGNQEVVSALAAAYFYLGDYDRAKQLIDGSWDRIVAEKRSDEVTFRGLIYFYQGEPGKAVETLNLALTFNPDNIPALNGLSRIFASRGDEAGARAYLDRIQQIYDHTTSEEGRKTKFVENIYQLKEAYEAKRYEEVIRLANLAIPEADENNKAVLYQYLYLSYLAVGKQEEAKDALSRAGGPQK